MGNAIISRVTANKEHTHTVNDFKNTYFYERTPFDISGYSYANMHSMIYYSGQYMGIMQSDKEVLFVYSENGTDFNQAKISDTVSEGIVSAIFTIVTDDFEPNIVILYGDVKYTLPFRNLRYSSNISFMREHFLTPPSDARSPDGLQYASGIYYLNEGYGHSSNLLGGIWTSTDGLTWEKVYSGACDKLLIRDQTFFMSQPADSPPSPSLERGIYTSTDLKNWTCVWKPDDFSDSQGSTDFQYINGEFVFTTYYNIYRSSDGLNWEKIIPLGAGNLSKNQLTYDSFANRWLWYSYSNSFSTIYTSYDLKNWELLYSHPAAVSKSITSIIPTSNNIIIFAADLYKSWHILVHDDAEDFFMPLSYGGTGASNKEQARKNLEVYSRAEIDSMLPQETTTLMMIYVSPSGNDSTGNGTEAKPYRTLKKALSVAPKIITYSVIIKLVAGSYSGVTISGFSGPGELSIQGASSLEKADDYIISSQIKITSNTVYNIEIVGVKNTFGIIGTLISGNSSTIKLEYYKSCPSSMQSYGTGITIGTGAVKIFKGYIENAYVGLSVTSAGKCVIYQLEVGATKSSNISVDQGGQLMLMDMPVLTGSLSKMTGGSIIYPNGTFTKG